MIEFYATGIPKGQPRPRAFAFNGRARVFDPGTAESWKSAIAEAAKPHIPETPLTGPLHVDISFYFPRPKKHFSKQGLRADSPRWQTTKPDIDNAVKAVLDALTILQLWKDDTQVCKLNCRKFYNDNTTPGAKIRVMAATEI